MEKNDFRPRISPLEDAELRDLPFADRTPLSRQESAPNNHTSDGCGCEQNGVGEQCGPANGICQGYEGCGEGSWGLTEYPLAMVYAPCQSFRALYDPATALNRGTLFTELDLPLGGTEGGFTTVGCACRAERRRT